jgi:hypothetical protein
MLQNFLGLGIGFVIINSITFLVSYLMQTDQAIAAMFVACFGSFISFGSLQFLPIVLLKRIFGLGLVIGFVGSFITGLFHHNYLVAQELNTLKALPTVALSQKSEIRNLQAPYFRLTGYKILSDFQIKYTKRNRTDTRYYYVMPIVVGNETSKDSIFGWVGFEHYESFGGESYRDKMAYILSNKAISQRILSDDSLYFAAAIQKAIATYDLKASKSYTVLEMTDTQMKEDIKKQNFEYVFGFSNLIWLWAGVFVIIRKPVADKSN